MVKILDVLRGGAQSLMMKGMPTKSDRNSLMVQGTLGKKMGKLNLDDEDELKELRNIIRELIRRRIKETSMTGDVAGYNTPYAFASNKKKWQQSKVKQTGGGWKLVDDSNTVNGVNK